MKLRPIHGWILVALLMVGAVLLEPHAPTPGSLGPRAWFGPFSELCSAVQWIRFQRAELRGEEARALALAESAIAFAPRDTNGWEILAHHLGLFLASREREPDLERRRAFFAAALSTTRRGAEVATEPARLHWLRGMLLLAKADLDPKIHSEGEAGLLRDAESAFSEARETGLEEALELERYARARANE